MMFIQNAQFSAKARDMFGTDNNAYSNKYHRGLFHGKTHGQRKKRVFSMKYRIETMKPNIQKKKLRSDILGKDFKMWISMKARKCIMKAGSLDNYLLKTRT
jgi:ribosomal protein L28